VVLDVDGVFANFNAGLARAYHARWGSADPPIPEHPNQVSHWGGGIEGWLQHPAAYQALLVSPEFWRSLPPLISPEIFGQTVLRLEHAGWIVYFATARPAALTTQRATEQWFLAHFRYVPRIALTDDRAAFVRGVGARFALDDAPHGADAVARSTTARSFVLDYPYNREAVRAQRVRTLQQFVDAVLETTPHDTEEPC
jgi:hypothetical protein